MLPIAPDQLVLSIVTAEGVRFDDPDDEFSVIPVGSCVATVTVQVADLLFDVFTVTVAVPAAFAVTVPFETVATAEEDVDHVTDESAFTVRVNVLVKLVFPLAFIVIVALPAFFAV